MRQQHVVSFTMNVIQNPNYILFAQSLTTYHKLVTVNIIKT
jgi:hypothetical protein